MPLSELYGEKSGRMNKGHMLNRGRNEQKEVKEEKIFLYFGREEGVQRAGRELFPR